MNAARYDREKLTRLQDRVETLRDTSRATGERIREAVDYRRDLEHHHARADESDAMLARRRDLCGDDLTARRAKRQTELDEAERAIVDARRRHDAVQAELSPLVQLVICCEALARELDAQQVPEAA
jgi:membrane protein involved in colicin uptake